MDLNMFCPKCGEENQDQAPVCCSCGGKIEQSDPPSGSDADLFLADFDSEGDESVGDGDALLQETTGEETDHAAVNQRVANRFTIEKKLGSGGMGTVYLANDEIRNRHVAPSGPTAGANSSAWPWSTWTASPCANTWSVSKNKGGEFPGNKF